MTAGVTPKGSSPGQGLRHLSLEGGKLAEQLVLLVTL